MSGPEESSAASQEQSQPDRRDFLSTTTSCVMAGGLAASYGTLGVMALRYLYPTGDDTVGWCYVATLDELKIGESVTFVSPAGAKVVIARQTEGDSPEAFIALSSVCPHLGCQVHWEPHNDRFFCPCHNGVFDPQGNPLEGPPAMAGQSLKRFPLRVDGKVLFIEAPVASVTGQVARDDELARKTESPIQEA
mgnify:CR=1 FL=1